jgi:Protein kinase domain
MLCNKMQTTRPIHRVNENISIVFDVPVTSQSLRDQLKQATEKEDHMDDDDDGWRIGNNDGPDYGGLKIRNLKQNYFYRRIHVHDEEMHYQYQREESLNDMDMIKHGGSPIDTWDEFDSDQSDPCMPPLWTFENHGTCNTIHETIASLKGVKFLGRGWYRDAFLYHRGDHTNSMDSNDDGFVMKKLHVDRDLNQRQVLKVNYEALAMEYLDSTGLVGKIYGHCGTTVLVECGHDLSHKICMDHPEQSTELKRGYFAPDVLRRLDEQNEHGFYQNNELTSEQKLDVAIAMVRSISLLHGFPQGVVAHDDISLDQWMVGTDGRVMLNDFNSIRPLSIHVDHRTYCMFHSRTGNYKAPEYFAPHMQKLVTEQSDIWPLGLVLYTLLTGTWFRAFFSFARLLQHTISILTPQVLSAGLLPYHDAQSASEVAQRTKIGAVPVLNPVLRHQLSFIERRIAEAMDRCLVHNPRERANVFWLLDYLHETKTIHHRGHRSR